MTTYTIEDFHRASAHLSALCDERSAHEEIMNDGQILRVILDTLTEELLPNERIVPYNANLDEFADYPECIEAADAVMEQGAYLLACNLLDADVASIREFAIAQYGRAYGQHIVDQFQEYLDTIMYDPETLLHDIVTKLSREQINACRIRGTVLQMMGHERRHTEQSREFMMKGRRELNLVASTGLLNEKDIAHLYNELPSEVDANTAGILFAIERL